MIKLLLQVTGWLLAHTPEVFLRWLCVLLGRTLLLGSRRRRRLVLSNLDHAFPGRSPDWKHRVAHESSRRLFETALISAAGPFLSRGRLLRMIEVDPGVSDFWAARDTTPGAVLVCAPHMAYWESLTWLQVFLPKPIGEFGVIFRPLDNPAADAWVKATRERHGMRLLSRKTGLQEGFKILKRGGTVGVLFDQNAGMQGALTTLCGRVCSTTELPGLLTERSSARVVVFYARRLGFWRLRYEMKVLPVAADAPQVTLALNRWLEETLSSDENLCASWLWSHDRWRNQDVPERRFRLEAKRNLLVADRAAHGWVDLPRKTRFWIRMPNWLGDVVLALPLIRALRSSRPDAEITLIAKAAFAPLLHATQLADAVVPLPPQGRGYFHFFWKLRHAYPDVSVLLTHSTRGDIEAWLTRAPQRFGVVRRGARRQLLTHTYPVPADYSEARHHQADLWEDFFRRFGLEGEVSRHPLSLAPVPLPHGPLQPLPGRPIIGLIAGSENTPEKRWPVEHWRTLIVALSAEHREITFVLFGTAKDRPITQGIANGLAARVIDLAGATDLAAYLHRLLECSLVVSNDTGGMHLANALGVPVVALFGPTNPVRTGPIYQGATVILQPPNCPPTGGADLRDLPAEAVAAAVRSLLPAA